MLKRFLLILLALLALSAGIALSPDKAYYFHALGIGRAAEEEAVRQTVRDFNDYLMIIYAGQGALEMIDLIPASTEMRHRLFKDDGYLGMEGKVLVYDMADFVIERVELTAPLLAEVDAYEAWLCMYQNRATRAPLGIAYGFEERYRYYLYRRAGMWQVLDYVPLRKTGA